MRLGPLAHEARLLGPGDDRAQELARRVVVLDLEAVRDVARRAEVPREAVHQEVERARDEDDLVPLVAAALHEVPRARVDGALEDRVERLVGEDAAGGRCEMPS